MGTRYTDSDCRAFLIDNPWSAAFISWVMVQSGVPGFNTSPRHIDYIRAAYQGGPSGVPYRLVDPATAKPAPGDLLCFLRERSRPLSYSGLAQALDSVVRTKHRHHATRPGQIALALADAEAVGLVGIQVDPRVLGQAGRQRQQQRVHARLVTRLDHRPQLVQGDHHRLTERLDPEPTQCADVGTTAQRLAQVAGAFAGAHRGHKQRGKVLRHGLQRAGALGLAELRMRVSTLTPGA